MRRKTSPTAPSTSPLCILPLLLRYAAGLSDVIQSWIASLGAATNLERPIHMSQGEHPGRESTGDRGHYSKGKRQRGNGCQASHCHRGQELPQVSPHPVDRH